MWKSLTQTEQSGDAYDPYTVEAESSGSLAFLAQPTLPDQGATVLKGSLSQKQGRCLLRQKSL